jgi:predicted esterase
MTERSPHTDGGARARLVVSIVAGACILGGAGLFYRRLLGAVSEGPLVAAIPGATPTARDDPPVDWCAPGFEPIAGGGCFASAGAGPVDTPLIVYLHGRYAGDASAEEVDRQRRLAPRAKSLGFAVLAFRGHLGACTAPELASWYCWPSNETNADAGASVVDAWTTALTAAQARTGGHQRYLLGFSNGGYFAGLIASRALLAFDAVVIAHGGPVEPVHALGGTPPLLLLSADDDVAQDDMIRFDEELTRERWAHDSYARAGGHALSDQDIDAALSFFARAGEPLPLLPPLPLHRAVRHVRDAGAEAGVPIDQGDDDVQNGRGPQGDQPDQPGQDGPGRGDGGAAIVAQPAQPVPPAQGEAGGPSPGQDGCDGDCGDGGGSLPAL